MTDGSPSDRLVDEYDLVIFDLDGVIYLVDRPIPSAVAAVGRLRAEGTPLVYATNNASRRATEVAALLGGMGLSVRPEEVITSARAAAELLAERFPAGSPVLVVGAEALRAEVRGAGLRPVARYEDEPVAVVQGYAPEVGWSALAEAALAIRAGAVWIATNTDRTLPTVRGPVPGNGALVAALRTALDREPDVVVGKPGPALFNAATRQAGARRPLVVGDRLDTDIEGAVRAGVDSLLVLTGISTPAELLRAPRSARPRFVAEDLSGLFAAAEASRLPEPGDPVPTGGDGWRLTAADGGWTLAGVGTRLGALRLLCAVAWSGGSVDRVRPGSSAARSTLVSLGLLR